MTTLQRTADLFRQRRRTWIPAPALVKAGGLLAWRSRISDLRLLLGMRIENRQQRTKGGKVISFYRYSGRTEIR